MTEALLNSGGKAAGFDAWRAIFLATLSNLLFKFVAVTIRGQ